jgi:prepilin-type N-terminal cleavage/methylation domain-containing protein
MRRARAKTFRRQAGLTLIELLIGIAISALIMTAFLMLYNEGQKYFFNQNAHSDAIEDSRVPMARISRDVRSADRVSDATVDADGTTYATSAQCLVLEVPSIDGTGMPIAGSVDYVIYAVDPTGGRRLWRIVEADETVSSRQSRRQVVADAVSAFGLVYVAEDGLTPLTSNYAETFAVDISLASSLTGIQRRGQPFVEPLTTQAKLRNKAVT